jgi:hypothetical protein
MGAGRARRLDVGGGDLYDLWDDEPDYPTQKILSELNKSPCRRCSLLISSGVNREPTAAEANASNEKP